jgi:hypothetical protein
LEYEGNTSSIPYAANFFKKFPKALKKNIGSGSLEE